VDLRVLASNDGAIASYRKCGFVQEGRERDSCWLEGQWYGDIILGLLAQSADRVRRVLHRSAQVETNLARGELIGDGSGVRQRPGKPTSLVTPSR
jgi:hypothetical protein